jgi:hypothetical protein
VQVSNWDAGPNSSVAFSPLPRPGNYDLSSPGLGRVGSSLVSICVSFTLCV